MPPGLLPRSSLAATSLRTGAVDQAVCPCMVGCRRPQAKGQFHVQPDRTTRTANGRQFVVEAVAAGRSGLGHLRIPGGVLNVGAPKVSGEAHPPKAPDNLSSRTRQCDAMHFRQICRLASRPQRKVLRAGLRSSWVHADGCFGAIVLKKSVPARSALGLRNNDSTKTVLMNH